MTGIPQQQTNPRQEILSTRIRRWSRFRVHLHWAAPHLL